MAYSKSLKNHLAFLFFQGIRNRFFFLKWPKFPSANVDCWTAISSRDLEIMRVGLFKFLQSYLSANCD